MISRRRCGCARPAASPVVRENDLRDLALFRRAQPAAALLEQFFGVVVRDIGPFADLVRRDHDKGDLAIFGRAELGLVVVEIGGQRFRRRRIDGSGLRGVEFDVFDIALFVLEAAERLDRRFGRFEPCGNGAGDLPSQRYLALIGDITLLGEAELADHGLEALRIEIAVDALEVGIAEDYAHGLGIGLSEAEPARLLVEGGFRDRLLQHLAVEAEGAGLIRRQRTAELAADLLQLVGVELAELVDRDFGMADRGQCRLAKSPEDVGDAPDAEADDQYAHHHGHNCLAEPV